MSAMSHSTMAYTFWFMPSGKVYDELSRMISQLSKKYSTPSFEPHVSLLGGIVGPEAEVFEKISSIASQLQPFEIRLTDIGYQDEFSRCLFIKAEESEELIRANSLARKGFNRQKDSPYMPHLTIIYGNLSQETKEQIIAEIGKRFDFSFEARKISVVYHSLDSRDTSSWKIVKEFSLKKS